MTPPPEDLRHDISALNKVLQQRTPERFRDVLDRYRHLRKSVTQHDTTLDLSNQLESLAIHRLRKYTAELVDAHDRRARIYLDKLRDGPWKLEREDALFFFDVESLCSQRFMTALTHFHERVAFETAYALMKKYHDQRIRKPRTISTHWTPADVDAALQEWNANVVETRSSKRQCRESVSPNTKSANTMVPNQLGSRADIAQPSKLLQPRLGTTQERREPSEPNAPSTGSADGDGDVDSGEIGDDSDTTGGDSHDAGNDSEVERGRNRCSPALSDTDVLAGLDLPDDANTTFDTFDALQGSREADVPARRQPLPVQSREALTAARDIGPATRTPTSRNPRPLQHDPLYAHSSPTVNLKKRRRGSSTSESINWPRPGTQASVLHGPHHSSPGTALFASNKAITRPSPQSNQAPNNAIRDHALQDAQAGQQEVVSTLLVDSRTREGDASQQQSVASVMDHSNIVVAAAMPPNVPDEQHGNSNRVSWTTNPDGLLNDLVIENIIACLLSSPHAKDWCALDTHVIDIGDPRGTKANRVRTLNLACRMILIPVFIPTIRHWTLAIVDRTTFEIRVYDPLPREPWAKRTFDAVQRFACSVLEQPETPWKMVGHTTSCHQRNGVDCGVYILVYAVFAVFKIAQPEAFDPRLWRRYLARLDVPTLENVPYDLAQLCGQRPLAPTGEADVRVDSLVMHVEALGRTKTKLRNVARQVAETASLFADTALTVTELERQMELKSQNLDFARETAAQAQAKGMPELTQAAATTERQLMVELEQLESTRSAAVPCATVADQAQRDLALLDSLEESIRAEQEHARARVKEMHAEQMRRCDRACA